VLDISPSSNANVKKVPCVTLDCSVIPPELGQVSMCASKWMTDMGP
jgi:hypothetical protein